MSDLFERAIEYMADHGWRAIPAKGRDLDQSLFDHCLLEIDVFLQMVQILGGPAHWDLTPREVELVTVALMAHDYGKTLPEWQDYLQGRRGWLSDVNRGLTGEVVPGLYPALGLGESPPEVDNVLENCINLHMGHERTAANLVSAILRPAGAATARWWFLAELVYHIDNVCSIPTFRGALGYLRKPETPFGKQLCATHHQVSLRGVSTVLLHEAAQAAFESCGWVPVLYFREATIYIRSAVGESKVPSAATIEKAVSESIESSFGSHVSELVVGNPTAAMLPKPQLFDVTEVRECLHVAGRRIGRLSFLKKPAESRGATKGRRQVVAEYLGVAPGSLDDPTVDEQSAWISEAQPEMVVFKFFKAITGEEVIGRGGAEAAKALYDDWLGEGAWTELQGTSTLMPAKDMRHVERFWSVRVSGFDGGRVKELSPDGRMELLVERLAAIAKEAYSGLSDPPSRKALAAQMADAFMTDLVVPAPEGDPATIARRQLDAYGRSKAFMGGVGRNPDYLCAICNTAFACGTEARADFLDKPESHTNRALSHGRFGKLVICDSCKYERMLRQLLLGHRASDVLILFPRGHIGREAGKLLMGKARGFAGKLRAVMLGDGSDPDTRVSFGLTAQIARRCAGGRLQTHGLSGEETADMFSYRASEENQRKRRRELEKNLRAEYGDDLGEANCDLATTFSTWDEAVEAVAAGSVAEASEIRRDVYGLRARIQLVCRTPNVIMMPLADPLSMGKESDTDTALRKVFVELGLALAFDCAVAIVGDSEPLAVPEPKGVAWVPPVGPARRLLGELMGRLERRAGVGLRAGVEDRLRRLATADWIPLGDKKAPHAERLFAAIGAASMVSEATNYSDRTDLFHVLSAPTVGHILRRIEQKDDGQVAPYHLPALQLLEEVMA